jgi:hypothetical protein
MSNKIKTGTAQFSKNGLLMFKFPEIMVEGILINIPTILKNIAGTQIK